MSDSQNAKFDRQRPHKPKTAAQRASEANTRQQVAINTHAPRPSDRQMKDQQGAAPGHQPRVTGGNTQR